MNVSTKKKTLAMAVEDRRSDLNIDVADMEGAIGIKPGTYNNRMHSNRWDKKEVPAICRFLGIELCTPVQIAEIYVVAPWVSRSRPRKGIVGVLPEIGVPECREDAVVLGASLVSVTFGAYGKEAWGGKIEESLVKHILSLLEVRGVPQIVERRYGSVKIVIWLWPDSFRRSIGSNTRRKLESLGVTSVSFVDPLPQSSAAAHLNALVMLAARTLRRIDPGRHWSVEDAEDIVSIAIVKTLGTLRAGRTLPSNRGRGFLETIVPYLCHHRRRLRASQKNSVSPPSRAINGSAIANDPPPDEVAINTEQ